MPVDNYAVGARLTLTTNDIYEQSAHVRRLLA